MGLPRSRRKRRVKYHPQLVVLRITSSPVYLAVARVVLGSDVPLQAVDVRRRLGELGVEVSLSYVSSILHKLERWGVVRAYRDPSNGRLLWATKGSEAARLLAAELQRQEAEAVLEVLKLGGLGEEGEEG